MTTVARSLWWVLGAAMLLAGVLLVALARPEPVTFSVLTYEPLPERFDPTSTPAGDLAGLAPWLSWWQVLGAGLVVLGLCVLVARVAYLAGRRRGMRPA